jgi:hypothetical protein
MNAKRLPAAVAAVLLGGIALWPSALSAQSIAVYPDGSPLSKPQNTSGHTASFGTSGLINGQSYYREILCTGQVTNCASTVPQSFTAPMPSIPVTFSTLAPGTGRVRLKVYKGGGSPADTGWYNVTVYETTPPTTSKMLPAGDVPVEFPTIKIGWCDNSSLNASSRWIKVNGVDRSSSFDYNTADGPSCTAKAASTTSTVLLNLGSNSVQAHICDNAGNCVTNTHWITRVAAAPPVVTPRGDTVLAFRSTTGLSQRFLVKNVDTLSHSYNLVPACGGAASGCAVNPPTVALGPGTSQALAVTYQTGTSDTGMVQLTATQADYPSVWGAGWVPVRTVAPPAPVVSLTANPGTDVERALCVAIAAGSSAAIECGDLRIVHPLPAIRTLNTTRQPVLLYNSATARPYPLFVAHVTVPPGALPDSVRAILRVGGVERASGRWAGMDWGAGGSTRQIALGYDASSVATGVYAYTLEVAAPSGTWHTTTALSPVSWT